MNTDLSLYIHIPYCLQKCHYCDFVKYSVNEIPPIDDYLKLLLKELELNSTMKTQKVQSLYFGGGTPSLLSPHQFQILFDKINDLFILDSTAEITLEINPGTVDKVKLNDLINLGFNRFSLGIQSFNDRHLNSCGRKHSSQDSHKDLELFSSKNLNFSADILFGLPNQSLAELTEDVATLVQYTPPHVSPYNLTLPEKHFFNADRASDETQVRMMHIISEELEKAGVQRYEISNFSRPLFESRHNQIYWNDQTYLGLGMGAHSYFKNSGEWGKRMWNTGSYTKYASCVSNSMRTHMNFELLEKHEALTDFLHTSLRPLKGFTLAKLQTKFQLDPPQQTLLKEKLLLLKQKDLIFCSEDYWRLTSTGLEMPNEVFKELCFLKEDLQNVRKND